MPRSDRPPVDPESDGFEPIYADLLDPSMPDLPPDEPEAPDIEPFDDPLTDDAPFPEGIDDEPGFDLPRLPDLTDEIDDWSLLEQDRSPVAEAPGERIVLPWSLRAELPALTLEVPAILDPTRPDSEWVVPRPPDAATHLPLRVRLGPVELRVTVKLRVGDDALLRLGRDALGDRILVRSTP